MSRNGMVIVFAVFAAVLFPVNAIGAKLGHSLERGWQLVSAPLDLGEGSGDAFAAALPNGATPVAGPPGSYTSPGEAAFPDLMRPGRACWVLSSRAAAFSLSGGLISTSAPFEVPVGSGWNAIATPWPSALEWSDARVSVRVGGETTTLSDATARGWLDGDLRDYAFGEPERYNSITPGSGGSLLPWRGYLLNSAGDAVLIFSPPAAAPGLPSVRIDDPADGAAVTAPRGVSGEISGPIVGWVLTAMPHNGGGETTLAAGSSPVNGLLGSFDPTLLLNGLHRMELTATSALGTTVTDSIDLIVEGSMKVGNFTFSVSDLNVPVSGLPIEVVRTYDSRDRRESDFGFGWTLSLRDVRIEETRPVAAGWDAARYGGVWASYCIEEDLRHLVTVALPTGQIYRFKPVFSPSCQSYIPPRIVTVGYEAVPGRQGSRGQLRALDGDRAEVVAGWPGSAEIIDLYTLDDFDNDLYEFTTDEGVALVIEQGVGLRSVRDQNGNTIEFREDGIFHSAGVSAAFQRDAHGRIEAIIDPNGGTISYEYDERGDLVAVVDQTGARSTYTYDDDHRLLEIIDGRGVRAIRNEYDDAGRLISTTDAEGNAIEYTHDIDSRREVVTDRLGHTTTFHYDEFGNVTEEIDALGGRIERYYDARDNVTHQFDQNGNRTSYVYDSRDNLLSEIDDLGNTDLTTYNLENQPTSFVDANGNAMSVVYDAQQNATALVNAAGDAMEVEYDDFGNPTLLRDEAGNETRYEYDSAGRTSRMIDAAGTAHDYTYDANGNTTSQTVVRSDNGTSRTIFMQYRYDAMNRLVESIDAHGNSTFMEYDPDGRETLRIDKLGRETRMEYDAQGRLSRTLFPDGSSEQRGYDLEGRETLLVDRLGHETRMEYDPLGRLVRTIHPDGSETEMEYDPAGRLVRTTESCACNSETRFEYDRADRQVAMVDALGNRTTYEFDAVGNQLSVRDPLGRLTRAVYDSLNRQVETIHADSTRDLVGFDALGRVVSRTDQAGVVTRFEYDRLHRLTAVIDALNQRTEYEYDEVGNLVVQRDALGRETTYRYDDLRRRTQRTLPLGMSEATEYDAEGNLTARTDFNGFRTAYAYDAMDRLVLKAPDPLRGEPSVAYAYNASGTRAAMDDAIGRTDYVYDARDRLVEKATPFGTLTYDWDARGNLLRMRSDTPGGIDVSYEYDALSRLTAVNDTHGGTTAYEYDAASRLVAYTYPNGVRTAHTFDALDRLREIRQTRSGSTIAGVAYDLSLSGHRLNANDLAAFGGGSQPINRAYGYDALYRLVSETISNDPDGQSGVIEYEYDAASNRLARDSTVPAIANQSLAYDANDRLLIHGYDDNGNTISSPGTAPGETLHDAYDFEDRLLSRTSSVSGEIVRYAYDGDGNRVARTASGTTTWFLVDLENHTGYSQVVEERTGPATTLPPPLARTYAFGHDLLAQHDATPGGVESLYFGYDGLGSVRVELANSGEILSTASYDAWGTPLQFPTSGVGFVGERHDAAINSIHLRSRDYTPEFGSFLTRDKHFGFPFNPLDSHDYAYAHLNPVNLRDPAGTSPLTDVMTNLRTQAQMIAREEFKNQILGMLNLDNEDLNSAKGIGRAWNKIGRGCEAIAFGVLTSFGDAGDVHRDVVLPNRRVIDFELKAIKSARTPSVLIEVKYRFPVDEEAQDRLMAQIGGARQYDRSAPIVVWTCKKPTTRQERLSRKRVWTAGALPISGVPKLIAGLRFYYGFQ